MKIIFLVQGEGRGHMTQAISLSQLLKQQGHELVHIFVGASPRREIPAFFHEAMDATIEKIPSPNFELDKDNKSLKILPSIVKNLKEGNKYLKSVKRIKAIVEEKSPDVIVNFYDLLGGLYQMRYANQTVKYFCVGHQYLAYHRDFPFPKGRKSEKTSFQMLNRVTSYGADKVLALSFSSYGDFKDSKFLVTPPLLRKEIKEKTTSEGDHILAYVVNDGYGNEILESHKKHPEQKVVCFWDSKTHEDEYKPLPSITFYQLTGERFMEQMSNAKGYVCTSGFESVCEAMYLGKKLMVVPVKNHFEQACNALDAIKTGLCVSNGSFDLKPLLDFSKRSDYQSKQLTYKAWVDSAEAIFEAAFKTE